MTHMLPRKLLLAMLLSGATAAQAENLLDIYHLAQQNDLTLVQAEANYQANLERSAQGTGQLLPSAASTDTSTACIRSPIDPAGPIGSTVLTDQGPM